MFGRRKRLEEAYAALYEKYCGLKKERDALQEQVASLKGEAALAIAAERLENEGLRVQIQTLEERKAKQWDNLLGYDGRVQRDNLGGGEDA